MFRRFHEMRERAERGFTLIELLVVILIIAILAAIAIPVFLRQREKGWRAQVQSALKNAATAQESYLTSKGVYTATPGDLEGATKEGLKKAADVKWGTWTVNGGTAYCMLAGHNQISSGANLYFYHSDNGEPREGTTCPAV